MLKFFNTLWRDVPVVFLDTETTGIRPGFDRAVQVGIARFERGELVQSGVQLVNPGIHIPPQATEIHGITDEMVASMPTIEQVFGGALARVLIEGTQPAAYHAPFDRHFVPPFGDDWTWPWLDCLSLVRVIDKYAKGKGRHKLEAACERHGVTLSKAHDAEADAVAAGELFYKLVPKIDWAYDEREMSLGSLLRWQRDRENAEWWRFNEWLSKQPPLKEASP